MNLHPDAVAFVVKHNCANHTPVELIQEAMEYGALAAIKRIATPLGIATAKLDLMRRDSQPHPETLRPIPYDPTIKA